MHIFQCIPFINYGIHYLNRDFLKNIVIFFIFFYSIYNLIAKYMNLNSNFNFLIEGYSSMWLILLYIIGAFYGKYIIDYNNNNIILLIKILIFFFATVFSSEFDFNIKKLPLSKIKG